MKHSICIAVTSLLLCAHIADAAEPTALSARKDCEELREEIAHKIESNGVRHYTLHVVSAEDAIAGRIIGSCNGGTGRIAYQRLPEARDMVAAATSLPPSKPGVETSIESEF
ncbi:MAG: DUF1161 domain-containing protein [Lysobacteraceae bacterium]